jgi:hypothetical protein
MMPVDLRAATAALRESHSRWRGFEQLTGWSILGLTFSSGEILGLRVFPYSDFAPYRSVWHRDGTGAWTVYVDGPSLEIGCPRWWGPALQSASLASIAIEWPGPNELRVTMDKPALEWTVSLLERPIERLMNLASAPMPVWSWRPRMLRAPREWLAHWALGMGHVQLDGRAPAGMPIVMMPGRIYGIAASQAVWAGEDLGEATVAATEPRVGDYAFPVRGVLAIGDFRAQIRDETDYRALRSRYRASFPARSI